MLSKVVFAMLGGIVAGLISDYSGGRATTCCAMLIVAAPMVSFSFATFILGWIYRNVMFV